MTFGIQSVIVILIVVAAVAFIVRGSLKTARRSTRKSACGDDCNCGSR